MSDRQNHDWGRTEWYPDDDEPPEWEQHDWQDSEGADSPFGDWSDDDEADTILCAECGADIYEDVPLCPVCGSAITRNSSPLVGRPNWYVVLGIIGILVTSFVLATGGF